MDPAVRTEEAPLAGLLSNESEAVLAEATEALARAGLRHYEAAGPDEARRRLATLLDLTTTCVEQRDLGPITRFAHEIGEERFHAGYGLEEVQTAFNVLEEALWRHVLRVLPPHRLAEALGLLSTVLGAGKDALARAYVSCAIERRAPSLDLSGMFAGVQGV